MNKILKHQLMAMIFSLAVGTLTIPLHAMKESHNKKLQQQALESYSALMPVMPRNLKSDSMPLYIHYVAPKKVPYITVACCFDVGDDIKKKNYEQALSTLYIMEEKEGDGQKVGKNLMFYGWIADLAKNEHNNSEQFMKIFRPLYNVAKEFDLIEDSKIGSVVCSLFAYPNIVEALLVSYRIAPNAVNGDLPILWDLMKNYESMVILLKKGAQLKHVVNPIPYLNRASQKAFDYKNKKDKAMLPLKLLLYLEIWDIKELIDAKIFVESYTWIDGYSKLLGLLDLAKKNNGRLKIKDLKLSPEETQDFRFISRSRHTTFKGTKRKKFFSGASGTPYSDTTFIFLKRKQAKKAEQASELQS